MQGTDKWCVMKRFIETFDSLVSMLERISVFLAGGTVAIIMVLVVADVVSRQIFNIPLYFINDLVTKYLFPFSVFSVLSLCFHKNYNVSIDILSGKIPSGLSLIYNVFSNVAILLLRSEEHTSELQSRPHLVCRLLLEKKKNNILKELTHNALLLYFDFRIIHFHFYCINAIS